MTNELQNRICLTNSYSTADFFEKKYLAGWTAIYLLLGLANVVFDRFWIWHEVVAVALFLTTLTIGLYWLARNRVRRALSALLALPMLWSCDAALSATGLDVKQRSFWITYPIYVGQIETNKTVKFNWAENGWFLGGGWQNTLLYEPDAQSWIRMLSKSGDETQFVLGTRNKFRATITQAGECENEQLRHLGGYWYLQTYEYGEGVRC